MLTTQWGLNFIVRHISYFQILSDEWALWNSKSCNLFWCYDGPSLSCRLNQPVLTSSKGFWLQAFFCNWIVVPLHRVAWLYAAVLTLAWRMLWISPFSLAGPCICRHVRHMQGGPACPYVHLGCQLWSKTKD